MRELSSDTTSITVKSPSMLAEMIARMPNDFDPRPDATGAAMMSLPAAPERPSEETIDTVDFSKLDDDNDWSNL